MKTMSGRIILLMVLNMLFSVVFLLGQNAIVQYNYTHGLPPGEIYDFVQDSQGYIWIGGNEGLIGFDGREFKRYVKTNEASSLAGSIINEIEVGPDNELWIGFDDNGITRFDHAKNQYLSKKYNPNDGESFPRHHIYDLLLDGNHLWISAAKEGLFRLNTSTFQSEKIPGINYARGIAISKSDPSILYISGEGLFSINTSTLEIDSITNTGYFETYETEDYLYCVNYFNSITAVNKQTKQKIIIYGEDKVASNSSLFFGHKIWIATIKGIYEFDLIQRSSHLLFSENSEGPLQLSNCLQLFLDEEKRIWIAEQDGLKIIDTTIAMFSDLAYKSLPEINDLYRLTADHFIASDFYNNCLWSINTENKSYNKLIDFTNTKWSNPERIMEHEGQYYIQLINGIVGFDPFNGKIVGSTGHPVIGQYIEGMIDAMILNNGDIIWINIIDHIFNHFQSESASIRQTKLNKNFEASGISKINEEEFWLYGIEFLYKLNLETGTCDTFNLKNEALIPLGLRIRDVINIDNEIWLGTAYNGLWKAHMENNIMFLDKSYGIEEGINSLFIQEMNYDPRIGLVVFSRNSMSIYDKAQDLFHYYDPVNGLDKSLNNGFKIIGDTIFSFSPDSKFIPFKKLNKNRKAPELIIEELIVNGEHFDLPDEYKIELKYYQNNLQIRFTGLDYSYPNDIEYRYRIKNDQEWIYAKSNLNQASFPDLNPGKYAFDIQVKSRNTGWNNSLPILLYISPPFWRTWWFVLTIIACIGLLIWYIIQRREKNIRAVGEMKAQLKELESESLRAQMNPHFVFNALNSIKSFIINNKKEEAADFLTMFSELIRLVLQNSKSALIPLSEELRALELYINIENIRLNEKFSYRLSMQNIKETNEILIPPMTLQPFVENAIWHGFVHKKEKGTLDLTIIDKGQYLEVEIVDDGVGRSKSKLIEQQHPRKRSFGISITRQRLKMQNTLDSVEITDLLDEAKEPVGTRVLIRIPKKYREPIKSNPK